MKEDTAESSFFFSIASDTTIVLAYHEPHVLEADYQGSPDRFALTWNFVLSSFFIVPSALTL